MRHIISTSSSFGMLGGLLLLLFQNGLGQDPGCGNVDNCKDCMDSGCGWVEGFGECLSDCSMIADIACYDRIYPGFDTTDAVCAAVSIESENDELCSGQTSCSDCVNTQLQEGSINVGGCQWFPGANYCANGCGMMGCGVTTCDDATVGVESVCGEVTEPCMNEANLAQCNSLVESGCQQILTMKSCPFQFACGDGGPASGGGGDGVGGSDSVCPKVTQSCMNEVNLAQCKSLFESGCQQILTLESCPFQFACGDGDPSSGGGGDGGGSDSVCPDVADPCMNEVNLAQCTSLVESGCQQILTLESCPLQFACGSGSGGGTSSNNSGGGDGNGSVCPDVTDPCMNEVNFAECTSIVESGCQTILTLESCPVQFACGDDPITSTCNGNNCSGCLNSGNSCGWVEGNMCIPSCNGIVDVPCYDSNTLLGFTVEEICDIAATNEQNMDLCASQNTCSNCVGTSLPDGTSCNWLSEYGICQGGCGWFGCGDTTCSDNDNNIICTGDTCLDCLTSGPTCGWARGAQCLLSCSSNDNIADASSCYDAVAYPDSTPEQICDIVATDENNSELCGSQDNCNNCVGTVLPDGTACNWLGGEYNFCQSGCGQAGCGLSICEATDCGELDCTQCLGSESCAWSPEVGCLSSCNEDPDASCFPSGSYSALEVCLEIVSDDPTSGGSGSAPAPDDTPAGTPSTATDDTTSSAIIIRFPATGFKISCFLASIMAMKGIIW